MKIALISDIHGNASALCAVLADLAPEAVDRVICLGDLLASGPQPDLVLKMLKDVRAEILMGNTDERLLNPVSMDDLDDHVRKIVDTESWIRQTLPASELAPLAAAPMTLTVELDNGLRLLCCHGSPRSLTDRLVAELDDPQLEQAFSGHRFDLLAAGHTHLSLLRHYGRSLLINPGSVGSSIGQGPIASYALLRTVGSRVSIDFRRVHYDVQPSIAAALSNGMPHGEWWAAKW